MIVIKRPDPCQDPVYKKSPSVLWGNVFVLALLALAACRPYASPVYSTPSLPENLTLAWDVLISVFDDIHSGRYEAVLKGLGTLPPDLIATLQAWDPDWQADPDDIAGILKKACTSGFVCLPIRRVVAVEPISETEYEFVVEHALDDGTVFILGPCCGASETEMPPQTNFTYRVVRDTDGQWQVLWAPIYVP